MKAKRISPNEDTKVIATQARACTCSIFNYTGLSQITYRHFWMKRPDFAANPWDVVETENLGESGANSSERGCYPTGSLGCWGTYAPGLMRHAGSKISDEHGDRTRLLGDLESLLGSQTLCVHGSSAGGHAFADLLNTWTRVKAILLELQATELWGDF